MPSRNIVKQFDCYAYYHVYNRGVGGQKIFRDTSDKAHFIKILARHLDASDTSTKNDGTPYRKFCEELELLCYCLMGNHFHLLLYQLDGPTALTGFMRSALTAYTMYFNKKYKRTGPLFQSVYKSSKITNDSYLLHITRYIHLNPRTYRTYKYSSLEYYSNGGEPDWIMPKRILDMFDRNDYLDFVEDYADYKASLQIIKDELADTK